jgi:hypothetical protein
MDEDNAYYAWSDQMVAGKAHGSRYYPRGVTSALWLSDVGRPLRSLADLFTGENYTARSAVVSQVT